MNPSKPARMGIGLVFAGLSFVPMLMATQSAASGELASVWWLVLAYFILELGEMCVSPIGLSAVTQLSIARVVGLMMGAFWPGTAYSEVLAARFGKLASTEIPGRRHHRRGTGGRSLRRVVDVDDRHRGRGRRAVPGDDAAGEALDAWGEVRR